MFMKKTLASIFIASMLVVSLGGVAYAQDTDPDPEPESDITTVEELPEGFEGGLPVIARTGGEAVTAITAITNWLFVILSIAAVIFIVLAGLQFITGGGNPETKTSARMKLMYAAVGIAVALLARAIPFVIASIIGGGGG